MPSKSGAELIREERSRQIKEEGYSIEEDKCYINNELIFAAISYATPESIREPSPLGIKMPISWPWPSIHWKPTPNNRVRELVKAAALIAAEIDRLNSIK